MNSGGEDGNDRYSTEPATALMGSLVRCDGAQGPTGKKTGKINEVDVSAKSTFPRQNATATEETEDRRRQPEPNGQQNEY